MFLGQRQRIYILIVSIKPNGDQINALLLILHLIPISTPPSIDHNSALRPGEQNSIYTYHFTYQIRRLLINMCFNITQSLQYTKDKVELVKNIFFFTNSWHCVTSNKYKLAPNKPFTFTGVIHSIGNKVNRVTFVCDFLSLFFVTSFSEVGKIGLVQT